MNKASDEFDFLRDRLKKIAILLISKNDEHHMEAIFNIGCLHSICIQNANECRENEKKCGKCCN